MLKNKYIASAHALAAVALFVALGGTSVAATAVRAITGAEVKNGSLTGKDVRNRSLTRADLAPGVLRAGPAGRQGPAGPEGPAGERGPAGPDLAGATHVRVRGDRAPAENGEALRAALASITDASAARPYVIQLAPGVYELGGTTLAMKPDVSITGAGAAATHITGDQGHMRTEEALVLGADRTVLRDVMVANRGQVPADFQNVMVVSGGATMRIEAAVLAAHPTARGFALAAGVGSSVDVRDSRLEVDGQDIAVAAVVASGADVRIRGTELVARSARPTFTVGLSLDGAGSTAAVENSAVVSSNVAVSAVGGSGATVGASRLEGRSVGSATCAASYNGSFAPVGADCN
jgi:hypothetical protein